jgi:hypothetical protein
MENLGSSIGSESGASAPAQPAPAAAGRTRFSRRFMAIYAGLGIVLAASTIALVVYALKPAVSSSSGSWSSWQPSGGKTAAVAKQIADHVAPQYHLAQGGQLVAVVPSAPAVTAGTENIAINAVAVRSQSGNTDITQLSPGTTEMYSLCGLGQRCSIATGKPSLRRGQLVRREALETALYTFKYLPAIKSVIVFMPPRKDLPDQRTVLFFQRDNLAPRLAVPLAQTLPLSKPPSVTAKSTIEDGTIDSLTLPVLYNSSLTQLQAGGALLVLTPVEV